MNGRIRRFALLALAACALIGIAVAWLQRFAAVQAVDAADWVEHTQAVRLRGERMRSALLGVQSNAAGFLLERSPGFADYLGESRAHLATTASELKALTQDNPAQNRRVVDLDHKVQQYTDEIRRALLDAATVKPSLLDAQRMLESVVTDLEVFDATENALLQSRRIQRDRDRGILMGATAATAAALFALLAALTWAASIAEGRRTSAEAEARYGYLFQLNPMPMWVFDSETLRFLDVNETALRKYGYSRAEFLKLSLRDLSPEEDIPALEAAIRLVGGSRLQRLWRHRMRDGHMVDVLVHPRDIYIDGRRARMVVIEDVTERERALRLLAERETQLLALSRGLMTAQEDERRAIARELHDDLVQALAAVKLGVEFARRDAGAKHRTKLEDASAQLDDLIRRVRDRALDLHPAVLDDLGLVAALEWYCAREAERHQIPVDVESVGDIPRSDAIIELTAYRIVQEAVANALRHSEANRIDVVLHATDSGLHVAIRDDGRGLPETAPGEARRSLGLRSMTERAEAVGGSLAIDTSPGSGTTVRAELPISTTVTT